MRKPTMLRASPSAFSVACLVSCRAGARRYWCKQALARPAILRPAAARKAPRIDGERADYNQQRRPQNVAALPYYRAPARPDCR